MLTTVKFDMTWLTFETHLNMLDTRSQSLIGPEPRAKVGESLVMARKGNYSGLNPRTACLPFSEALVELGVDLTFNARILYGLYAIFCYCTFRS